MRFLRNRKRKDEQTLILYGTKSGNAKLVANQAQAYFQSNGVKATCYSMAGISPRKLKEVKNVLIVVSTHGEGEPPSSAKKFFKEIYSEEMPELQGVKYAVCALGDSGYDLFCQAGKDIDFRLRELKANPLLSRVDCDITYSETAVQWIKNSLQLLKEDDIHVTSQDNKEPNIEKSKEYCGVIIRKEKLSKDDQDSPCYHIEIEQCGEGFNYQPGDAIEFRPVNPDWLVENICDVMGGDTIKPALKNKFEICSVSAQLLIKYAALTKDMALNELLSDKNRCSDYIARANFLDLISDFPADIEKEQLLSIVPKLKHRQYSIASSQRKHGSNIHLTVKAVRFNYNSKLHEGAGSVYITAGLDVQGKIRFRHVEAEGFRLPVIRSTPIIMIGVGTGIAPFRAFLQELGSLGVKNKAWLIWGERHQYSDFLYEEEMKGYQKDETLAKADFIFSRDGEGKTYVQNVLSQREHEVLAWLNEGAHIYLCGSVAMQQGVLKTLNQIISSVHKPVRGISSVNDLIKEGCYHEDVY